MNERRLESTKIWETFCDQLKLAGSVLVRETTPDDDLTQAEGLRKLVRMIRMGFEVSLEHANADFPELYQHATATTVEEGETSDARYHQAVIDGSQTYRVTGKRGEAPYMEFSVYAGKVGLDETSAQVGAMTELDLKVDRDGSFELILSPEKHPGNWIKTTADATLLYVRQYSHDWSKTTGATFEIVREGAKGSRPPISLANVEQALTRTAAYAARGVDIWAAIVDGMAAREANCFFVYPEEVTEDSPEMPTGHRFSTGYFRLASGESLEVTFAPADVPYWGLDLTNYWFEPLSYMDHRSHLNNQTVQYEADGSVRIIIGEAAAGSVNWMDTRGHREGTMVFRWSRTNEPVPEIDVRVV